MATGTIQVIQNDIRDKWYLANGLTENDVIAAYQFAFAPSEADALVNINEGTKYTLRKGSAVRWRYCSGMDFLEANQNVWVDNSTIKSMANNVKACVFGFHMKNYAVGNMIGMYLTDSRWLGHNQHLTSGTQWGFVMNGGNGWRSTGWRSQTGILGCNFEANYIYVDGVKYGTSTINPPYGRGYGVLTYQAGDLGNASGMICPALVLYNKALTDAQHIEVAKNITDLGAIR